MKLNVYVLLAIAAGAAFFLPGQAFATGYQVTVNLLTPDINNDGFLDHAAGFNSSGTYTYLLNLERYNNSRMTLVVDETGVIDVINLHYEGVLVRPNGTPLTELSVVDMEYRNDITLSGAALVDRGVGAGEVALPPDSQGIWNHPDGSLGVVNVELSGKANNLNQVFTGNFNVNPFVDGVLDPDLLLGSTFFGQGWGKFTNAMHLVGFDLVAYGVVSGVDELPDGEPIPEPAGLLLLGAGLLGAGRRKSDMLRGKQIRGC